MILLDVPMQTRLGVMDEVSPCRLMLPHRCLFRYSVRLGECTITIRIEQRTALRFTSHVALYIVLGESDPVIFVRVYEFRTASGAFDDTLDVVNET